MSNKTRILKKTSIYSNPLDDKYGTISNIFKKTGIPLEALDDSYGEKLEKSSETAKSRWKETQIKRLKIDKFIVEDGVAIDLEAGLMWLRFSYGQDWKNGKVIGEKQAVICTWETKPNPPVDFRSRKLDLDWRAIDWCSSVKIQPQGMQTQYVQKIEGKKIINYFGYTDWRIPTVNELETLIYTNTSTQGNYIDTDVFCDDNVGGPSPSPYWKWYWSSNSNAVNKSYVFLVDFYSGNATLSFAGTGHFLRLVRSITLEERNQLDFFLEKEEIETERLKAVSEGRRKAKLELNDEQAIKRRKEAKAAKARWKQKQIKETKGHNHSRFRNVNKELKEKLEVEIKERVAHLKTRKTQMDVELLKDESERQEKLRIDRKIEQQKIDKFIVEDGVATDLETGLMWLRFSYGQDWKTGKVNGKKQKITWDAIEDQRLIGYFGYTDWRIPTANELETLIDKNGFRGNYINSVVFCDDIDDQHRKWYWTSSSSAENFGYAFIINFYNGNSIEIPKKAVHLLRLVRSITPEERNQLDFFLEKEEIETERLKVISEQTIKSESRRKAKLELNDEQAIKRRKEAKAAKYRWKQTQITEKKELKEKLRIDRKIEQQKIEEESFKFPEEQPVKLELNNEWTIRRAISLGLVADDGVNNEWAIRREEAKAAKARWDQKQIKEKKELKEKLEVEIIRSNVDSKKEIEKLQLEIGRLKAESGLKIELEVKRLKIKSDRQVKLEYEQKIISEVERLKVESGLDIELEVKRLKIKVEQQVKLDAEQKIISEIERLNAESEHRSELVSEILKVESERKIALEVKRLKSESERQIKLEIERLNAESEQPDKLVDERLISEMDRKTKLPDYKQVIIETATTIIVPLLKDEATQDFEDMF